ncbi:MAG: DNA polymerase III subunit delta [Woeseia sp.]
MKIPLAKLEASLTKPLMPCYLVAGDETLLVGEALDAIRAAARQKGFGTREVHDISATFDWNVLAAAAGSLSLFAERRIIEIRIPTGKPGRDGSAAITELLRGAGDDLLILIETPKLDRTAPKWVQAVDSAGAYVQVWPLAQRELPAWIADRMQKQGLKPDRDAVRLLADRVEGNLLAANQEIDKLGLLLGEGPVSGKDIEGAVADSSRFNVYKLVDAAVEGQEARAVRMLGRLRTEGIEPVIIMWALTRELRALATVAEEAGSGRNLAAALRKAGVWSSREPIVRRCIGRHGKADFYRLLQVARRGDAAAKGQAALDPWQLATEIVFGLAGSGRKAA